MSQVSIYENEILEDIASYSREKVLRLKMVLSQLCESHFLFFRNLL